MRTISTLLSCFALALALGCGPGQAGEAQKDGVGQGGYGDELGTVRLPASSCSQEAVPALERGLALLHHMTYGGAREAFAAAADADPDCALGTGARR